MEEVWGWILILIISSSVPLGILVAWWLSRNEQAREE